MVWWKPFAFQPKILFPMELIGLQQKSSLQHSIVFFQLTSNVFISQITCTQTSITWVKHNLFATAKKVNHLQQTGWTKGDLNAREMLAHAWHSEEKKEGAFIVYPLKKANKSLLLSERWGVATLRSISKVPFGIVQIVRNVKEIWESRRRLKTKPLVLWEDNFLENFKFSKLLRGLYGNYKKKVHGLFCLTSNFYWVRDCTCAVCVGRTAFCFYSPRTHK